LASHIFVEARADADMAATILEWLRTNRGHEYTARSIWGHLPVRYPLGAVSACLDTLYRNKHLTRRKTSRGRFYTMPATKRTR
jgi:hypothetical protein